MKRVETVYDNIAKVMNISRQQGIPTYLAADRLAEERIARASRSRRQFLQNGKHILSGR